MRSPAHPNRSASRAGVYRRGSAYAAVLGASTIIAVIGMSALTATRIQHRAVGDTADTIQASLYAQSAIDLALFRLRSDPNWRQSYTSGAWKAEPIGQGPVLWKLIDEGDGNLADDPMQPVQLYAKATLGQATRIHSVQIEPDNHDYLSEALLEDSPLAYWRLGEEAGTVATDATGHHPGTYRNNVDLGESGCILLDPAPAFDGYNDFVEIPHSDRFLLDNGTVEAWFKTKSPSQRQGIFTKDSNGYDTGGHLTIELYGGRVYVRLQSTSGSYYVYSGGITAGTWYHFAFTFGSAGMKLYLNGSLVDTYYYTGGLNASLFSAGNCEPIAIGVNTANSYDRSTTGWSDPFIGSIDEVAVYHQALSSSRIQTHYEAGARQIELRFSPGSWRREVE